MTSAAAVLVDVTVPELGESVTEATVARWYKAAGDAVARDETIAELETDKVNLEVFATASGVLREIVVEAQHDVVVGAVIARIEAGAEGAARASPDAEADAEAGAPTDAPADTPAPPPALSPAVRKLIADRGIDPSTIEGTGKGGRILKGDVPAAPPPATAAEESSPAAAAPPPSSAASGERREPMSRLRRRIAERLKQAQNTAAMLTTFNEVDMSAVMRARADWRDAFETKYGVRLGFMSFFVKAAVVALREQPAVNAQIDGDDIVYRDYCNVGVAVGAPQGLVVPVLRDAERMSFADIERAIADFGRRAREGALAVADMAGGTFTVSNGGVYGSLMSTPILNPPQSAILGMHKIEKRPVVVGDSIVARPMMYLALSYDHRIVDGRQAVTFLVRIKECIEDPRRIMLDI